MSEEAAPSQDAADIERRKLSRMKIRPMDGSACNYDDLNRLPPVEIDDNGFAVRPWTPSNARERVWTLAERQVRWLLFWNYSCGNKMIACQEAGVTRAMAEEWCREAVFQRHMEAAKEDIADRLLLRVAQRTGLMPMPEGLKVHDGSLFGLAKKYRPDMFGDIGEGAGAGAGAGAAPPRPDGNIPRPPKAQAAAAVTAAVAAVGPVTI